MNIRTIKDKQKVFWGNIISNIIFDFHKWIYEKDIRIILRIFYSALNKCNLSLYAIECIKSYQAKYQNVDIEAINKNRKFCYGAYTNLPVFAQPELTIIDRPDICLSVFNNVYISGNSDIIIDKGNNCVINDFCFYKDNNYSMIDGMLYRSKGHFCILRNNLNGPCRTIASGIMISGKFSTNYYHQLFENLIRVLFLTTDVVPSSVPIIIDESVFAIPSIRRIFELLTQDSKYNVIAIGKGEIINVKKLYSVSPINIISPKIVDISKVNHKAYLYDPDAIILLKEKLLRFRIPEKQQERIFITRKHTNHRNFNEKDVFDMLKQYGFVEIAPEDFSFEQQMAIFNDAKYIVGASGAAFSNILFCTPGCKILCFRSSNYGLEPPIFNTIALINQCLFSYVSPKTTKNKQSVHSNFQVDVKSLEEIIVETI